MICKAEIYRFQSVLFASRVNPVRLLRFISASGKYATMKLSILLTLLAATVCSVFAAHGGLASYQANGTQGVTQSGEAMGEASNE